MNPSAPPSDAPADPAAPRRVLVAGAGGFLGRGVVRSLTDQGVTVHGLVRDPAKGELVRAAGGIPFIGDVLDPPSLRTAARGCDSAVQLAAHPSRDEDAHRVREEGTRRLVQVAREENLHRLIVGSGYWVYPGQADPIHESAAVDPQGESRDNFEAERAGLEGNAPGTLDVLVVRPGMVYGNGSWFRTLALSIASGSYSVVGDGTNRWSFVALSDAANAFTQLLAHGRAGEVYNVVDGNPAPLREFVDFVASRIGATPPPSIPWEEAAREMGEVVARHLSADRPTSSQKLLGLGWKPTFSSYREGLPSVLREIFPRGGGRGS